MPTPPKDTPLVPEAADESGEDDARASGSQPPCRAAGCRRATTGHKPYCIDHLAHLPRIQATLDEIKRAGKVDATPHPKRREGA